MGGGLGRRRREGRLAALSPLAPCFFVLFRKELVQYAVQAPAAFDDVVSDALECHGLAYEGDRAVHGEHTQTIAWLEAKVVEDWLREVYAPIIAENYQVRHNVHPLIIIADRSVAMQPSAHGHSAREENSLGEDLKGLKPNILFWPYRHD